MNDIAEHESRFHDYGEQVDGPYPQMSEHPLRSGVMKLTADNGDGTYTATEQVWAGAAWTNGTAPGQYVGVTVRDIASSTAGAVNDYVPFWEQYTQAGVIELIVAVGLNADEKVKVDSGDAAAYLEDQVDAETPWITVTKVSGKMQTAAAIGPCAHSGGCAGGNYCNHHVTYLETDAKGRVRCWYSWDIYDPPGGMHGPCA